MSGRQDKKMRKVAKKELNPFIAETKEKFQFVVAKKPRYFPRFIWAWLIDYFFDIKKENIDPDGEFTLR